MNVIKNIALIVITIVAMIIAFNFKLMLMLGGNLGIALSGLCLIISVISPVYLAARNINFNKNKLV